MQNPHNLLGLVLGVFIGKKPKLLYQGKFSLKNLESRLQHIFRFPLLPLHQETFFENIRHTWWELFFQSGQDQLLSRPDNRIFHITKKLDHTWYLSPIPPIYLWRKNCHVEKFQISMHDKCGDFWNFSTCRVISNLSTWQMWRNLNFLHMLSNFRFLLMTDVEKSEISPHVE